MAERSLEELLKSLLSRLGRLERRIAVRGGASPDPVRGTTAERDSLFGIPANAAARAGLANQRVTWFNTEKGWEESYYAVTGTAGLTAPGLLAGYASGWYPLPGADIYAWRGKTDGFQSTSSAGYVDVTLTAPQTRRGGMVASGTSGLGVPVGGYYDWNYAGYHSGGGPMTWVGTFITLNSGSPLRGYGIYKSDADIRATDFLRYPMKPTDTMKIQAISSSASNVFGTSGYDGCFIAGKYAGPPLVNG